MTYDNNMFYRLQRQELCGAPVTPPELKCTLGEIKVSLAFRSPYRLVHEGKLLTVVADDREECQVWRMCDS